MADPHSRFPDSRVTARFLYESQTVYGTFFGPPIQLLLAVTGLNAAIHLVGPEIKATDVSALAELVAEKMLCAGWKVRIEACFKKNDGELPNGIQLTLTRFERIPDNLPRGATATRWIGTKSAARTLDCSRTHVLKLIHSGAVLSKKFGQRFKISAESLALYTKRQQRFHDEIDMDQIALEAISDD